MSHSHLDDDAYEPTGCPLCRAALTESRASAAAAAVRAATPLTSQACPTCGTAISTGAAAAAIVDGTPFCSGSCLGKWQKYRQS